jgi:putative phosphoribosyl transferase
LRLTKTCNAQSYILPIFQVYSWRYSYVYVEHINFRKALSPKFSNFLSNLKSGAAFQLKFKDRVGAGQALGLALKMSIRKKKGDNGRILVLGIPKGGVIVADIVAKKLDADFDIISVEKLRAPFNKEDIIGAVLSNGFSYLDEDKVRFLKADPVYADTEKAERLKEAEKAAKMFRPSGKTYHLKDRTVIVVEDGIDTPYAMIAVARWLRTQNPSQLIVAAPVAQPHAVELLKREADSVEIMTTPSNYQNLSQLYNNLEVTDENIMQVLRRRAIL